MTKRESRPSSPVRRDGTPTTAVFPPSPRQSSSPPLIHIRANQSAGQAPNARSCSPSPSPSASSPSLTQSSVHDGISSGPLNASPTQEHLLLSVPMESQGELGLQSETPVDQSAAPPSPALSTTSFGSGGGTIRMDKDDDIGNVHVKTATRKISFSNLLDASSSTAPDSSSNLGGYPSTRSPELAPRKLSGPQRFIRRAKSFTTSPILVSSPTFGRLPDSEAGPSNVTSTASSSRGTSPKPTSAATRRGSSNAREPSPSNALPAAMAQSTATQERGNGKEKEKDSGVGHEQGSAAANAQPRGRRMTLMGRRSTLSIFRRNDSSAKAAASDSSSPASVESPVPSPTVVTSAAPLAPLPSLPSLQFSSAPYRMSWGFGANSAAVSRSSPNSSPSTPSIKLPRLNTDVALSGNTQPGATPPPFRRTSSAGSPVLRRNGSWAGSTVETPAARELNGTTPGGSYFPGAGIDENSAAPARRVLTRASRSHSDGIHRFSTSILQGGSGDGVANAWQQRQARSRSGSASHATLSASAAVGMPPFSPGHRPPSPLKMLATSVSSGAGKRPATAGSLTSIEGKGGVFSAVSGLFGGSSSMSRSSSSNSAVHPPPHDTAGGASEFGALFGGGASSSSVKGRKRGLSVGDRLFGTGSSDLRARSGSSSNLATTWLPSATDSSLLVPSPGEATTPTPTTTGSRSRASTDPRRLSSSSYTSQSSYFPPYSTNGKAGAFPSGSASAMTSGLPSPPDSFDATRRTSVSVSRPSTSPPASRKSSFSTQQRLPQQQRSRATSIRVEVIEGESPVTFVQRLSELLNKGDVARVLASSAEPFYAAALEHYFTSFDFMGDPLDIALRKFLMTASLPTETQQIDRVVETFAKRYSECNPGLYSSNDTPYVLAFSLIMLSTDQFNPSNKSKMSKADYVRNTRLDDVAPEILEYFYDQISLTPFVYVEDDSEFGMRPDYNASGSFFGKSTNSSKDRAKFDPYHLISSGNTRDLRIDVESVIPSKSPFSFTGTTSFFNATTLHQLFARAPIIQITASRPRSRSGTMATPETNGAPLAPVTSNTTFVAPPKKDRDLTTVSSLKITKIGLLSRKEDLAEGGKKAASRKWRGWSVILTGSQLLFFKDPNWASALQRVLESAAAASAPRTDDNQVLVCSLATPFKPDAVLSLANSAAIHDSTYDKYSNVFRLVAPAGRQYLFQAHTAEELNSWLHAINYAATFKSANLRIRPLHAKRAAEPDSPTAAGSTSSDAASQARSRPHELGNGPPPCPQSPPLQAWGARRSLASSTSSTGASTDSTDITSPTEKPAPLLPSFVETTSSASNGLNVGEKPTSDDDRGEVTPRPLQDFGTPVPSADVDSLRPLGPTRAEILRARIAELEDLIRTAKTALQVDLRLARNFAVLTPFRSSTRERIQLALPALEQRIRHARLNLAKLVCHREVLSRDLLVEDRENRPSRRNSQHQHRRVSSRRKRPSSPLRTPQAMSQLWQSTPAPASTNAGDSESDARDFYESAPEDFETRPAATDDELDRLRPPPMQRSHTDTTWAAGRTRPISGASGDELPTTRPFEMSSTSLVVPPAHPAHGEALVSPSFSSNGLSSLDRDESSAALPSDDGGLARTLWDRPVAPQRRSNNGTRHSRPRSGYAFGDSYYSAFTGM